MQSLRQKIFHERHTLRKPEKNRCTKSATNGRNWSNKANREGSSRNPLNLERIQEEESRLQA